MFDRSVPPQGGETVKRAREVTAAVESLACSSAFLGCQCSFSLRLRAVHPRVRAAKVPPFFGQNGRLTDGSELAFCSGSGRDVPACLSTDFR